MYWKWGEGVVEGTWFACCQMMAVWMRSIRPPFSVRCTVLPTPLTQTPLDTPWEEVCCTVAALNQHRPNEVSHLTPSSLRPSLGCQSHNEQPSISSAWLTHFDSWESLGPVSSKLPLSKCHHRRIHQPHLWAWHVSFFFFFFFCFLSENKKQGKNNLQTAKIFFLVCVLHLRPSKHPDFLFTGIRPSAPNGSRSPPRCWWAWPLTYWPKTLLTWTGPGCQ